MQSKTLKHNFVLNFLPDLVNEQSKQWSATGDFCYNHVCKI